MWPVHPAAELFPLISEEELTQLAEDIKKNGLNNPVWLYRDGGTTYLLDGRNRVAACERAGVSLRTRTYAGTDPIGFSVSQNLMHRHLTVGQKAMVGLKIAELYAAEAAKAQREAAARARAERERAAIAKAQVSASGTVKPQVTGSMVRADLREPSSDLPAKTARSDERQRKASYLGAKAAGVSQRAMEQAKRVATKAPDLAEKVQSGGMAIDRADRIIRDREAEQRRVERARKEAEALAARPRVTVRQGDFREVLADLHDIDAVITDPPYPYEFVPLLKDLAEWADKVLKPDGVLAVLFGQTYLPEVYELLGGYRKYRWTMAYLTPGSGYASQARRVQSNWKPVIVYGGGPRFADIVRSEGQDASAKDLHMWGQDYGAFHTLVRRLTEPGQVVCDPFMGSGTTLLAAQSQGRHSIGCDIDAEHVATARRRLGL